jgi:hypothetical protein
MANYATVENVQKLAEEIAEATGDVIEDVQLRIDALEARIAEFTFKGPWTEGQEYKKGNFVSHGGSLFVCEFDTKTKPGSGAGWALAVARGRDGRDFQPPVRTVKSARS